MSEGVSLVEYFSSREGYSCGYCKSPDTNCSQEMWAHALTAQDYQDLMDRGWRRCGCYCYKPTLHLVCCPMYTIKCEALNFNVSKSQRKVLKKMRKFLQNQSTHSERMEVHHDGNNDLDVNMREVLQAKKRVAKNIQDSVCVNTLLPKCDLDAQPSKVCEEKSNSDRPQKQQDAISHSSNLTIAKSAATTEPSPSKGPFRKAKLIRIERKRNKLLAQGKTPEEIDAIFQARKKLNQPCRANFNQLFEESCIGTKKLEFKLVNVTSDEFKRTLKDSAELFKKYQMTIHKEPEHRCNEESFLDFLVKSPLKHWRPSDGPPDGYGSFHQQYWLDNELIAVAVIDILPASISSVYFFYDPKYSHLTLGTYSSLREIYMTRQLNKVASNLKYYYMGFYIHSCPKMRYKARMRPSKLLCPETYAWIDIEPCLAKLDKQKYARFNEDLDAVDENGFVDIQQVLVLYRRMGMMYNMYAARVQGGVSDKEKAEIQEYANLVGKKCASRILLYRSTYRP